MTRCKHCNWLYTDNLTHVLTMSNPTKGTYKLLVCGICALELTNKLHGTDRKQFDGQQAEIDRQGAVAYRKRYPDRGPATSSPSD